MPIHLKLFQNIAEEGWLPNLFNGSIDSKTRQRYGKQENHRPTSLTSTDAKCLEKISANLTQFIIRIMYHDQVGFIPGMQE